MEQDSQSVRINELEAENARLRRLLDTQGMPAELRHHIRNTLAMLRAIVRRSAESSETVEIYAAHLSGRLDALARVQSAALRAHHPGLDLHSLFADELLVHLAREGEQVQVDGPSLRLHGKAAEIFALAIHELATNAVEHGVLSRTEGRIHVSWTIEPGPADEEPAEVHLSWVESGAAAPLTAPTRSGFGREVLERTLRYELKAEARLTFEPDGLHCTIRFPLSAQITRDDEGD